MAKMKNYMMDVEETVCNSVDLEDIITDSDSCQIASDIVCSLLSETLSSYKLEIAKDYVEEVWCEFWGRYA